MGQQHPALEKRKLGPYSLATVKRALSRLHKEVKIIANQRTGTRGYFLPERLPLFRKAAQERLDFWTEPVAEQPSPLCQNESVARTAEPAMNGDLVYGLAFGPSQQGQQLQLFTVGGGLPVRLGQNDRLLIMFIAFANHGEQTASYSLADESGAIFEATLPAGAEQSRQCYARPICLLPGRLPRLLATAPSQSGPFRG